MRSCKLPGFGRERLTGKRDLLGVHRCTCFFTHDLGWLYVAKTVTAHGG
jgi:hypothetical protein